MRSKNRLLLIPYPRVKRVLDFVCALSLLIVFAPLGMLVAMAIWLVDGLPVLFLQARPGLHARPFVLVKFRTMTHSESVSPGNEAHRVTRLGWILRQSSVDELPSLVNVLRGEMSFVGPRPLLLNYVKFYTSPHSRRHEVRPGITGLAQVSGRNHLSWKERLDLDMAYTEGISFWLDTKIMLRTLTVVLRARGVNPRPGATMEPLTEDYMGLEKC